MIQQHIPKMPYQKAFPKSFEMAFSETLIFKAMYDNKTKQKIPQEAVYHVKRKFWYSEQDNK